MSERMICPGIDTEIQTSRELDGAQHAHGILFEPNRRVPYRSHRTRLDVLHSTTPVQHHGRVQVVEERVDGKVAPFGVFIGTPEGVVISDQKVLRLFRLRGIAAEGRGFDDLSVTEKHVHQAKAATNDARIAEQLAYG